MLCNHGNSMDGLEIAAAKIRTRTRCAGIPGRF
jgi:hypothetical protein